MTKVSTIVYSTILAFIDVYLFGHMFNVSEMDSISAKFFLDIILSIATFVVMVITYGKILLKKRVLLLIYVLVTVFGLLKAIYYFDNNNVLLYRDMKRVLFAIFIYLAILFIVRVTFIGFERPSKREIPQIILVVFLLMLPVVSKMYMSVDIAVALATQIMFVSMVERRSENKHGKDRRDCIKDIPEKTERDSNV